MSGSPSCAVDVLLLGRAFGFAVLVVLLCAAPVWAMGLVPADGVPYFAAGIGASLIAALLAICVHGRFLDARAPAAIAHDGRLLAGRLQALLAVAFGAKLAVLVLGVIVLQQAGVKFEALATFCITFAAVSLVSQMATAAYLSRALNHRVNRTPAAPPDAGTEIAAQGSGRPAEQDHQP
ncbi:MAG TPA: hypothetical protein VFT55_06680 [Planctomycetota bacterium]|nr:hypothetical protein [Planctomycetota bacterium]